MKNITFIYINRLYKICESTFDEKTYTHIYNSARSDGTCKFSEHQASNAHIEICKATARDLI